MNPCRLSFCQPGIMRSPWIAGQPSFDQFFAAGSKNTTEYRLKPSITRDEVVIVNVDEVFVLIEV